MKRKSIIISLLALLLIFPILAQAAPVGKFTSIEGNVDVTAPGKEAVKANLGDSLNVGDIIRTKSKSKCEVAFIDGSILRLAENSRLRVSEFTQEKEERSAILNLFRGKIQNIVKTVTGAAAEQSKYEIQMPTSVVGVRGTNFFAYYQAGISGAIFKEGTGYGYSLNRPQEVRTINPGQAMVVISPDLPPVIKPATALELQQHEKDTNPSEKPKEEGKKEEEKAEAPKVVEAAAAAALMEMAAPVEIIAGQPPPTTPYVPQTVVSGGTNFKGTIYGGMLDDTGGFIGELTEGTFSANIPDNKVGTMSASGTLTGGAPIGLQGYIEGTSDKGGAFFGPLGGVQGSWLNRTSALYVEGGNIYFLAGDSTGTLTDTALSMSGSFGKSAAVGTITLTPGPEETLLDALKDTPSGDAPQFFPSGSPSIISNSGIQINPSYFNYTAPYLITNEGKKVASIGNMYTGSYTPAEGTSLPYLGYAGADEYALGPLSYSHDSTNHEFTVDTLLRSIGKDDTDVWYLGVYSMRYLGMYRPDGKIFRMAGAGTYEGTPLAFMSEIKPDLYYYNTGWGLTYDGTLTGLLGGTESLWSASPYVTIIGEYDSIHGAPQPRIWYSSDIYSYNSKDSSCTTYDSGAYHGFMGGIVLNDNLEGKFLSLYIDPSGKAGYLSGGLSGKVYPDIEMFEMGGTIIKSPPQGTVAEVDIPASDLYSSITRGNLDGRMTGNFAGIDGGAIRGWTDKGDTFFIKNQMWGIYGFTIVGEFETPVNSTWSSVAGGNYSAYGDFSDYGYWLADIKNGTADGNKLTGTVGGKFITYSKFGTITGDLLGAYNTTDKTWQAVSLGTYRGKPLFYANSIEGDLYQQNRATIHEDSYEKPDPSNSRGPLSTLRASTFYVKSLNPANLPQYGWQMAQNDVKDSKNIWSRSFDAYYPSNEASSYRNTNNLPRLSRTRLSDLSLQPDFSTADLAASNYSPTLPPTAEFGIANISPNTYLGNGLPIASPLTVSTTQYARTFEWEYDLNVLERVLPPSPAQYNQTLQGNMGLYQLDGGAASLWATDSAHPLGLTLLGNYQDAAQPLVFSVRRFYSQNYAVSGADAAPTPDGGAYFGIMSGTLASDRSLAGALYSLYVSPTTAGTWEAGILKTQAPLTGHSYAGINMWDAAGQLYRVPKAINLSSGIDAGHLLDRDTNSLGGLSFINIPRGALGDPILSIGGISGQFGTGGTISTLVGAGFGNTLSIEGLPDFGIFELLHGGIGNAYSNPGATWRMDMASVGQFGRYTRSDATNYADSGFWTASIEDGVLSGTDKLSGTLNGYFLTYKKEGTLTGNFLGNLKPDSATAGIWQGASAGIWEKTRDVAFSSGIAGNNFGLSKNQVSGNGGTNNFYNVQQNQDGNRWAEFFSTSGSLITRTKFDYNGPPDQTEYNKSVWVKDTVSGTYTLQEATKIPTLAEYNDAIDALRTKYKASPYNYSENTDTYWMGRTRSNDGIIAGFDNPWNAGGSVNVRLIGNYEQDDRIGAKPALFGSTIISFDPLVGMNPYNNSRSPVGGAYYGYLGAAYGTKTVAADWMDGMINGLYLNPSGSVGIFSGKFTGNNNPQVGIWTGAGTIQGGYDLGTAASGLTEANFASKVILHSSDLSYGPGDVAVTGDDVQLRANSHRSASIDINLVNPSGSGFWGIMQNRGGGTFSGNPTDWVSVIPGTVYSAVHINTTTNGVITGDTWGASIDSTNGNSTVNGGGVKGLFDPVKSTWQAVSQGIFMETATFMNKVGNMTTDAQRQAFTDATKIPCFTVGTTDLRGGGSVTGGTLDMGNAVDATKGILSAAFYASSTGGKPQVWASGNVTGAYTGSPTAGTVSLSGYAPGSTAGPTNGISANFNVQQWGATKWGATVTSGSVPAGTSGFTYPNAAITGITFQGGAAGTITGSTFSGTAAGIVK